MRAANLCFNMSATLEKNKEALETQGNKDTSNAPSLTSEEAFTNPTGINEKALLRRLDLKLLPPLSLLYLLSFLDRSNSKSHLRFWSSELTYFIVGNAKLEGLTADLHITGNQYLLTLTVYFIGYVSLYQPILYELEILTSLGSF